jgi:5-methyltetrahydropteroyltriglutamate--homocysteine methyltransferase
VAAQVESDFRELVSVQEQAGLDLLSDGMLGWRDLFRPLTEAADGLEARPLTRFLDTNTFYRAVLVDGEPLLRAPLSPPDLPTGRWIGTLPSPFAFARAADERVSAGALAANVLAPQIEAWAEGGCALVVLSEPFLARAGEAGEAVTALTTLPDSVPLALQLVFGDASSLLDELAEAPVAAVGVDFYLTPADALPEDYPKEILAGVVDARSSALEDPDVIASFVDQLVARRPAGISLVPNGDLQFVSEKIAREKLVRLGRARQTIGEVVPA